jgi:alkylation response protein AidB-like acyl-CoA dehydrogenase
MRFVLREVAGLHEVLALPGFEDTSDDVVDAVLAEAARFAEEVLDPLNRVGDTHGARFDNGTVTTAPGFADAYRKFVDAGWNGLSGDPDFGGQGLPHLISIAVQEIWNSANMAFCLAPMLTSGVLEAFRRHATPDQQARFLRRLTSGEWTGTMNLTEPQAGSDLSAVRTMAVPEGDRYRLRGTKIFITWGEHDLTENIVHLVLARTPDAPEGVKGISLFIVPKYLVNAGGTRGERNDVKCISIEHKMGIHGSPTCVLAYGEEQGAVGYLVGEENRGLEYMFTMMNHARLAVGVEALGLAERAYQHALDYARTRVQGREVGHRSGERVAIVRHPDVRRMLLTMRAQIEAMRALAYSTAAALDAARRHPDSAERARNEALVDLLTPIVKGWCTEQGVEIASLGVQVHGGMGFIEESGAAQYLRDARITTIYEGTTGIQANDLIGRKVAFERGTTALEAIASMRLTRDRVQALGEAFAAARQNFAGALDALEAATRWLVDTYPRNARAAAAVGVPYLKLFGNVAAGDAVLRGALAARERLDAAAGDAASLAAKIDIARFYCEHVLPLAAALAESVLRGSESVLALDDSLF